MSQTIRNWRDSGDGSDRLTIPMTPNATDDADERSPTGRERRRYAELNVGEDGKEEYVIFDRENHEAWIQSTVAVSVEETY